MAAADVQLITTMYERWSQGDYKTGEFFDPAVEFARIGETMPGDAGEWRGLDEMWAAAVSYIHEWDDYGSKAERIIDLGDRILVADRQTGRGRRSGIVLNHVVTQIFTVRDAKIVHWDCYWDSDDAARAAGIDPAVLSAPG
jgi:ketosteroid isomerase-like protein